MCCLSVKVQRLWIISRQSFCLQFLQSVGCWHFALSMSTVVSSLQLTHRNTACFISGYTSEDLITMPLKLISLLMLFGPKFLTSVSSSRSLIPDMSFSFLDYLSALSTSL